MVGRHCFESHGRIPRPLTMSPELEREMQRLLRSTISNKGNKGGQEYRLADICCICGRKKHVVKWSLKDNGVVTGSWCYLRNRASKRLNSTKNFQVLTQLPDLKSLLKAKSAELLKNLLRYSNDKCNCRACVPRLLQTDPKDPLQQLPELKQTWKSKTRLWKKTHVADYLSSV